MTSPSRGTSRARTARPSSVMARRPRRHGVRSSVLPGAGPSDRMGNSAAITERAQRTDQPADQQPPPAHAHRTLERLLECGQLVVGAGELVAFLGERAPGHQPVGPDHEPGAQGEEPDAEEGTFGLWLAAERVDDGQRQRAEHGDHEAGEGDARRRHRMPGVAHERVPIQRTATTSSPRPTKTATAPSANGPRCHSGAPPRSSAWSRYRTYRTSDCSCSSSTAA